MGLRFLKTTLRSLTRRATYTWINIAGLALGLASVMLMVLFLRHEMSFDRFHPHLDRLYRVQAYATFPGVPDVLSALTPGPLADALKEEVPEVELVSRVTRSGGEEVTVDDQPAHINRLLLVDGDFLRMFDFSPLAGDAENALDEPFSLVLTRSEAEKLFGSWNDAVGREVIDDGDLFSVTAIVEDVSENSHLQFTALASFSTLQTEKYASSMKWMMHWRPQVLHTYVRLMPDADPAYVNQRLEELLAKHYPARLDNYDYYLTPVADLHLRDADVRYDLNNEKGSIATVRLFMIIAGSVLLLAAFNFVNLSTAVGSTRSAEVGIRKVTGASRSALMFQFVGESLLLSLGALVIAFVLVELAKSNLHLILDRNLALGSPLEPFNLLLFVAIALGVGLLAGLYPALWLSSRSPLSVLKTSSDTGNRSRTRLRRALVTFQFMLSGALIVGTLFVRQQYTYMSRANLGFDTHHLYSITLRVPVAYQHPEEVRQAFANLPAVESASATNYLPVWQQGTYTIFFEQDGALGDEHVLPAGEVDRNFFHTLGVEMSEGRDFLPSDVDSAGMGYIVNQEFLAVAGWEDGLGKRIRMDSEASAGHVVGVIPDIHLRSMVNKKEPVLFQLADEGDLHLLLLRLAPGDLPSTIETLRETWAERFPEVQFDGRFVDAIYQQEYEAEQRLLRMTLLFTGLALLIAGFGLYGLATFAVQRRMKEIGIRKVLGATRSGLVLLLSREALVLVVLANLLAWPVIGWLMNRWLEGFAYHIQLGMWPFLLTLVGSSALALLTAGIRTSSAASMNPSTILRDE